MPLLSIETNVNLAAEKAEQLVQNASALVAEILNKSEHYVMVKLSVNAHMSFAGNTKPLVYAELKSLGLPEENTKAYSAALSSFLEQQLDVKKDRVYIEFTKGERHLWGWNGTTF